MLRLLVLLLVLLPAARAQAELPLPLHATLVDPPLLDEPLVVTSVAVDAPGAADASVALSEGGLVLRVRLDALPLDLTGRLPLPVRPVVPRPFAPNATEPAADATSHDAGAAAPPAPPAREALDAPGLAALSASASTPLETSPLAARVALGVTALLAILARLYSRFSGRDVLKAEPRACIHDIVSQQPGATLAELAAATGLSRGAVVHHCQMLERHGLLASRHDGVNRRFYLAGPRVDVAPRPPTAGERRLLDLLRERGPLTQAEAAALLGVTPQAVSHHLLRLRRASRVEARRADGQRRWAVADAGEE